MEALRWIGTIIYFTMLVCLSCYGIHRYWMIFLYLRHRREVPRPTSLGARGALPREVGTLIPPPGVPAGALAPPAAPSPRAGRARDRQTSDASRRENAEVWLFENCGYELNKMRQHTPRHTRA